MIGLLLLLVRPPQAVVIATPRGLTSVPVSTDRGGAAVAEPLLVAPLGVSLVLEGTRATVTLGGAGFVFELGVPYVSAGTAVCPLAGEPYMARDTLYLPLNWLAECVPRALAPRYRWDAASARLDVMGGGGGGTASPPLPPNPLTGLRQHHTIVIDPGHGGRDPGNPGLYFPEGRTEKDITLAIGKLLRAELLRRGLAANLTRSTDTLVDLADRASFCREACDLFVSIHVNAMPPGRHSTRATGIETYFLSEAKTEDQKRVAEMENDAIRFETDSPRLPAGGLGTILKDLQLNE